MYRPWVSHSVLIFVASLAGCAGQPTPASPTSSSPKPTQHADAATVPPTGGGNAVDAGTTVAPDAAGTDTPIEVDTAMVDEAPAAVDTAATTDATGSAGQPHAALVWGYGEERPTPKPTDPLMPLDLTMKAQLEAKGLIVDTLEDKVSTAAAVMGTALIVISNSVDRRNLLDAGKGRFRDVKVPAIVMKDGVIEEMGMGTGSNGGFSTPVGQTQISIVLPDDPLAAGLMGNVTVYTKVGEGSPCPPCYLKHLQISDRLIYAFPGPAAKTIATIIGNAKEAAIFAYASGATMVGGLVAPAKRMGFFIHRDTDYSPEGIKLFDAAVDYLLAP